MFDGAVADACLFHTANQLHEGFGVLAGVAVQLDIGDVPAVGQRVVGSFQANLLEGVDVVVDRNVEGVGVVVAVGDARDDTEALAVNLDKSAGQPFCRGGNQRKVELHLFAGSIHPRPHMTDDLQSQVLRIFALSVVLTNQSDQRFCQPDEADGQRTVAQHLPDLVLRSKGFAVQPDTLSHQEGEVDDLFLPLDAEAVEQLLDDQINLLVEQLKEEVQILIGKQSQTRQVDGSVGQVAATGGDFAGGVIDVGSDAGAAAHIGDLGFRVTAAVVLQVIGCIQKGKVGEQPFGGNLTRQTEQVVVRVFGTVVDPFLYLEDVDGEDGRFAVPQTGLLCQQKAADDHSALGGGVGPVVERAEGSLCACAGVHGV